MQGWQKEEAYEAIYRAGRQAKNLYRYIPERLRPAVIDALSDSDGYWIYLDAEHAAYDGEDRIIHEYSITDLKRAIKTIRGMTH